MYLNVEVICSLSQKDTTVMNQLNCNQFNAEIEQFKLEGMIKMKMKKMDNPYGYPMPYPCELTLLSIKQSGLA